MHLFNYIVLVICICAGCQSDNLEKVNGVNLVGPRNAFPSSYLSPITELGADYVAIIPFAFSRPGQPAVTYGQEWQWWGERTEGVQQIIKYAREHNLKIMLKPHVWIAQQGWPGEYILNTEEDWQVWEKDYEKYILDYVALAHALQVEIFCIGTEYRIAVKERPDYWRQLISKARKIYNGKITYAANWDNYRNIDFWQELDYIGINAYWSLSANKTPTAEELAKAWQPIKNELSDFSKQNNKPVMFTEYGYQSIDYAANGHWNLSADSLQVNTIGQANAYEALYQVFWQESWFAGGFLWKWFPGHLNAGGMDNKRFTPQRKHAEKTIQQHFLQK